MSSPHLEFAKKTWKDFLRCSDSAVDATCGRGRDTLFLCQIAAQVYAFDIQPEALAQTRSLLEKQGLADKVALFQQSHAVFPLFPSSPRLFVYNLGYLPRGDKTITTQTSSTLQSVASALTWVQKTCGALSIMCYPGHPEGAIEKAALLEWASSLCSDQWLVRRHHWTHRAQAPSLLWIEAL